MPVREADRLQNTTATRLVLPKTFSFVCLSSSEKMANCGILNFAYTHVCALLNRPRSICFAAQRGNYTKSRPGGRRVEIWRQPRVSLILSFLVTFRYFVSEMVLTCAVSIYIICKYGNGEIFTQSEEENGPRHL